MAWSSPTRSSTCTRGSDYLSRREPTWLGGACPYDREGLAVRRDAQELSGLRCVPAQVSFAATQSPFATISSMVSVVSGMPERGAMLICSSPARLDGAAGGEWPTSGSMSGAASVVPQRRIHGDGHFRCDGDDPVGRSPEIYEPSTPNGIRTRVTALKGRRPRPLDDGGRLACRSLRRRGRLPAR